MLQVNINYDYGDDVHNGVVSGKFPEKKSFSFSGGKAGGQAWDQGGNSQNICTKNLTGILLNK
jgi:hypothetical protein